MFLFRYQFDQIAVRCVHAQYGVGKSVSNAYQLQLNLVLIGHFFQSAQAANVYVFLCCWSK